MSNWTIDQINARPFLHEELIRRKSNNLTGCNAFTRNNAVRRRTNMHRIVEISSDSEEEMSQNNLTTRAK